MHHHRRIAALSGALVLVVLAPAVAGAATTRVVAGGPPPKDSRTFHEKYGSDANLFFPAKTTIRVGDSVKFEPYGFHNMDLLKKQGGAGVPLFSPQGTVSGVNDAAGSPFWFNGQPKLGFTPTLLKSNFGKTVSYSGARSVNSGLPLGPAKPMKVRFTEAGVFTFLCDVHPGMKGTVHVKSRRSSIPSARAHARAAARQIAAAKKAAQELSKTPTPADTVLLGAYKGGADYFDMLPKKLTVARGTTVTFAMDNGSREVHTATFGPGDGEKGTGYVGEIAKSFESPEIDPRGMYSSAAPGTTESLTTSLHGNGFWNSGILAGQNKIPNVPSVSRVTFPQAGTFAYFCAIHPNMKGEVVVQ